MEFLHTLLTENKINTSYYLDLVTFDDMKTTEFVVSADEKIIFRSQSYQNALEFFNLKKEGQHEKANEFKNKMELK